MAVNIEMNVEGIDEFVIALQRFDRALQEQIRAWLNDWAQRVATQAERNTPVRTGYLRSTIYAEVKEWVAAVGARAAYSYFVEFGTRYMMAQPFLYPAVQSFLPELETNIVGAIEQAKSEAGL
jgi:HK97 gp10 family phage protein